MTDSFNVFVIGPMGADKDEPLENRTPISSHMENIAKALRIIMPQYIKAPSRWEVFSPLEGATDITEFVFTRIDDADLAVADITTRSPSVMYELAYFHALGTPIIVLDYNNVSAASTPFYLKGVNLLRVSDFDVDSLTSALNERFQKFFDPEDFQNFSTNPITSFYGAPLMEISGAATIARGYYRNFVSGIINSQSGIAALYKESPIEKLYILKSSSSLDIRTDIQLFESAFPGKKEHVFSVQTAGKERRLSAHYDGRAIFDLPRTVYTLAYSPRIQRLEKAIRQMPGLSENKKEEMRSRTLSALVTRFYDAINERVIEDEMAFNQMVEFVGIANIKDFVQGQ